MKVKLLARVDMIAVRGFQVGTTPRNTILLILQHGSGSVPVAKGGLLHFEIPRRRASALARGLQQTLKTRYVAVPSGRA